MDSENGIYATSTRPVKELKGKEDLSYYNYTS
jgi:hypothetical protein